MREERMKWVRRIAVFLPAAAIMGLIFYFSAQPDVVSAEQSTTITEQLVLAVLGMTGRSAGAEKVLYYVDKYEGIVRKLAHMTEYAVLAASLAIPMKKELRWTFIRSFATALCVSVLYAATDEIHQLFVEGRAGRVLDVLIDGTGALAGAFLAAKFIHNRNTKE